MDNSTGILLSAIQFAAIKHRDQRRKDAPQSPYINHPVQVANLLWDVGGVRDESTLVAAILHDTIEDTATSPDEIRARFGQQVLTLVLEVTDDRTLPSVERKRLQIEHAPHLSTGAKLIKLGDKLANLTDILHSPPTNWTLERKHEYMLWTAQVVSGLRGTNAALEQKYDETLAAGKKILEMA
jgi:(p)ppGpp synthase/HD superfamily hydrolase